MNTLYVFFILLSRSFLKISLRTRTAPTIRVLPMNFSSNDKLEGIEPSSTASHHEKKSYENNLIDKKNITKTRFRSQEDFSKNFYFVRRHHPATKLLSKVFSSSLYGFQSLSLEIVFTSRTSTL